MWRLMHAQTMDKDNRLNKRFCWPPKDRARAESPSKAPRTSSVLTASVLFASHSCGSVSGPRRVLSAFSSFAPFSRAARGTGWLGGDQAREVGCGCCSIGLAGQSRRFRKASPSRRRRQVPPTASMGRSGYWKGGVALFLSVNPENTSLQTENSFSESTADPDWRVLGAQDWSDSSFDGDQD